MNKTSFQVDNNEIKQERVIKLLLKHKSMTLEDIKEKYCDQFEEKIPFYYIDDSCIHQWIMSIKNVLWNGTQYNYKSHQRSKSTPSDENNNNNNDQGIRKSRWDHQAVKENKEPACGSSTPIIESPVKIVKPRGKSENRSIKTKEKTSANMYGILMIGDDFLLGVAMMELNFEPQVEEKDEERSISHCGYCVSGLTINDATERVREMPKESRNVIVYLGSIDIIQGKSLAELESSFKDLLEECRKKTIFPILCTLAPIPTHQLGSRRKTLDDFNKYLEGIAKYWDLPVVDINKAFLKKNSSTFEEYCYAIAPRAVSGMTEWIAPWSKIGRSRFCVMMKKSLGAAIMANGFIKLDALDF